MNEHKPMWTGDETPIVVWNEPRYFDGVRGQVVRSGILCLIHGDWEMLVWDGLRIGPRCCVKA